MRSPSVLLQISLSNPEILDEIEEEAYYTLGNEGDTIDDAIIGDETRLSTRMSIHDQPVRSRIGTDEKELISKEDKKKREEEEKIAENGPYLEPGLIDHICVVGPANFGNTKMVEGARGWIGGERFFGSIFY